MKRLLREPLLHFLALGAAVFAAFSLLRGREPARGTIVVSTGQIESLATVFARTWLRPPTERELEGLLRDYVREEVAAREALALGLDRDDTIVRRRLQQKLEFVTEDLVTQAEPSEAELRAYHQAHPDVFRAEPRLSFRHVYLSPERRGQRLAADAQALLVGLRRAGPDADLSTLGDPFLLEHEQGLAPEGDVARAFGVEFAAALRELPVGEWHGPIASGFGAHLVLVRERIEGSLPAFEAVREAVEKEWRSAQRTRAKEKLYETLLQRYSLVVEKPPAAPGRRMTDTRP